jgi:hypothetical protein
VTDKYYNYSQEAISDCIGTDEVIDGWVFEGEPTYDNLVWKTADYTKPTSAEFEAAVTARENAQPIKFLRMVRDGMLRDTDHWAYQDTPTMTTAQTNYRQALRDITNTYTSLDDVVWPTTP